jgi:hypothetical protein
LIHIAGLGLVLPSISMYKKILFYIITPAMSDMANFLDINFLSSLHEMSDVGNGANAEWRMLISYIFMSLEITKLRRSSRPQFLYLII